MVNKWGTIGIPADNRFLELYYEPESEQFLAHFYKGLGDGIGLKSLYARHFSEEEYRRLTPESKHLTYEDVVISPELSKIYVNVYKVRMKNHAYDGYEWHSVREFNPETGGYGELVRAGDIKVAPPYCEAWIHRLRSIKDDGKQMLCTIAFKKDSESHTRPVDYYLCKYNLISGQYRKITKLNKELSGNHKTSHRRSIKNLKSNSL